MTLHTQVVCILLAGLATLYLVFGTSILVDRTRFRALTSEQIAQAFPLWAGLLAALGLACVAFATHYLLLGDRALPYPFRFAAPLLCIVILASAAYRRVHSK